MANWIALLKMKSHMSCTATILLGGVSEDLYSKVKAVCHRIYQVVVHITLVRNYRVEVCGKSSPKPRYDFTDT